MSTVGRSRISRFISHLIIVMMFCTAFSAFDIATSDYSHAFSKLCKVTASTLIVRKNAGTKYSKIGSIKKGTYKVVKGTKKDSKGVKWYKVSVDKKTGYICSKYVDIISLSVKSVKNKTGKVKISSGKLTARSGPGSVYGAKGSLKNGKTFKITGKAKDVKGTWWYRFKLDGSDVFVSSKYVKVTTTETTSPAVTSVSYMTGTVNVSSGSLNVRSGAGEKYDILGTLAKGKTFTITGKITVSGVLWYQLKYNSKKGYVSSKYVTAKKTSTTAKATTKATTSSTAASSSSKTYTIGTVKTSSSALNVRSGAGTQYSVIGTVSNGSIVQITGSAKASDGLTWYKYNYSSSKVGYISSSYVTTKKVTSDAAFENEMTKQGFPESYKESLRVLHATHPKWTFKAYKVGTTWTNALNAETKNLGTNLVASSLPTSYRSTASGSYNSKTKTWTKFDGSWYAANSKVVAYYMDPRNFLNESGIYQFMNHKYDSASQNATTVAAVVKGTFMETRATGNSTYKTFASLINAAGKSAGVNPNVIAAMIVQEQGTNGTSGLISGTYSGYKGYYNFFNIGAYTTSTMNAIQRGLWYAKQSGSYGRPWNSIYASIKGGALFYGTNYVQNNQDTYYYKKFNVKNGVSSIGSHQYMTNVSAAASEGAFLKKAFQSNTSYAAVVEIPVYNSMPSAVCKLP